MMSSALKLFGFIFSTIICVSLAGSQNCIANECKIDEDSLRFFLLGDWGGKPIFPYYSQNQKDVAKILAKISGQKMANFFLALGDNFYFKGVKDANDKRFKETFENVFKDPSLQIPWYVIAGNHDHYGNVQGEIDYSAKSQRWTFPSLYYPINYNFNGIKVDIIMIDTITLCGNTNEDWFAKLFGKSDQPSGPKDKFLADQQLAWIEDQLKNSKADYLFVAGHFPVYSVAEHGSTQCLIDKVLPLLETYKATAYLSGHDHSLQHLQANSGENSMNFVVSGTGSILTHSKLHEHGVPKGSLKYFWPDSFLTARIGSLGFGGGGFVFTELNAEKAHFEYYRGNGKLLYQFDVPKRQI